LLANDQFSVSVRGTHTVRANALLDEQVLRAKLLAVQSKVAEQKREAILEEKGRPLRDELIPDVTPPLSQKTKQKQHYSDDDEEVARNQPAIECFLRDIRCKINNGDYIDFASISTSRLMEIKLLNSTANKTTKIVAGLLFKHSLSEADVATMSEDLYHIHDGFFYQYLKMLSESQIEHPLATIIDRIQWWQWMSKVFKSNHVAMVKFIKEFVGDYSHAPLWAPMARTESDMVMRVKSDVEYALSASLGMPPPATKRPSQSKHSGVHGSSTPHPNPLSRLTPTQNAKLLEWKARFPNTCLSRLVKGRMCKMEGKSLPCRYLHVCPWCSTSACRATCPQAEHL
jgi:hypothetical protein